MERKYKPKVLFLEPYNYDDWPKNEESTVKEEPTNKEESTDKRESTNFPPLQPQEDDEEEVKEGTRIKILTWNKLLTRLPILLAQIKTRNISYKLENKIWTTAISFVSA